MMADPVLVDGEACPEGECNCGADLPTGDCDCPIDDHGETQQSGAVDQPFFERMLEHG